jgi:hypothetical protein
MIRDGHEDVTFFVGTEVEHSPAYGMRTLFVVGVQDPAKIVGLAQKKNCEHIYFGANMSFPNLAVNDPEWHKWESMIGVCLMHGAWCTLDIDVSCAAGLLEGSLTDHSRFIPMISVKLPYTKLYNYNTTIKIDDKDFKATNPGVWCHSLHDLQKRSVFTDWSKYTQDEVIPNTTPEEV